MRFGVRLPLNAKEFAVLAGLSYTTARAWFRLAGFPVVQRRVFWSDFVEWVRSQLEPNKSGMNSRPERPNGPRPGLNLDLPPQGGANPRRGRLRDFFRIWT